jgi:hypothetical protein
MSQSLFLWMRSIAHWLANSGVGDLSVLRTCVKKNRPRIYITYDVELLSFGFTDDDAVCLQKRVVWWIIDNDHSPLCTHMRRDDICCLSSTANRDPIY